MQKTAAFSFAASFALTLGFFAAGLDTAAAAAAPLDPGTALIVNDRPVAGPYSRAVGWPPVGPADPQLTSNHTYDYFNAPSRGSRCEILTVRRTAARRGPAACD